MYNKTGNAWPMPLKQTKKQKKRPISNTVTGACDNSDIVNVCKTYYCSVLFIVVLVFIIVTTTLGP